MKLLLNKNMLILVNHILEPNCNIIYNNIYRANDKKEDLRRHHFEFGGVSSPMTTT
jgi:hypothetical protein